MIKVALVDDHQLVIDGLYSLLSTLEDIKIVGQANSGIDLIELLLKEEVDLVLMDISMPRMDGIEATNMVKEKYPEIKVLILSMHDSVEYTKRALKAGADGFLLKNAGSEELQLAIHKAMNGENYFSDKIMQNVVGAMKEESTDHAELTERELEVLKLIAMEFTTKEIAEKLFISHHTVESHRKNLLFKLNARSVAGLVKYAIENGLTQ